MKLNPDQIHIIYTELAITDADEHEKLKLLSRDEQIRAERFHTPIHRKHFIAARAALREILSLYLSTTPEQIEFAYTDHKKPFLKSPRGLDINFNLAHSHDLAVYALALNIALGIDIEKVDNNTHQGVADKYFSKIENDYLHRINPEEKASAFYRIWTAKEAIVKGIGKGLGLTLAHVSIDPKASTQTLTIDNATWQLCSLTIHPDYQATLASNQIVKSISYWHFFNHKINLSK